MAARFKESRLVTLGQDMNREISDRYVPFRVSENVRVFVREHEGMSGYPNISVPVRVRRRHGRTKRHNQQTGALGALKVITIPIILIALWSLYSGLVSTSGIEVAVGDSYAASVLSDPSTYGKYDSHASLPGRETRPSKIIRVNFPSLDNPISNWLELSKREAKKFLIAYEEFSFRI